MTITTRDGIISALGNNASSFILDKSSISNTAAGQFTSLWRATGQPGQGAIPTAAAVCDHTLTGSMGFTQQTAPATSYGGWANVACSNSATTIEVHDRLMHMGGLSGTVTTAQTVNVNLDANLGTSNLAARLGDANYSGVQWWLEWYTDTGSTAVNATCTAVYSNATTATITVSLAATRRAGFMLPLNRLVPAAQSGLFIRAITQVQLSATTGTAGNFGVTATRPRLTMPVPLANKSEIFNLYDLGFPEIYNSSCLFPIQLSSSTITGTVRGGGKIAHG